MFKKPFLVLRPSREATYQTQVLFSEELTNWNCIFPVAYGMLTCDFQGSCPAGLTGHDMHTSFCSSIGSLPSSDSIPFQSERLE